MHLRALIFIWLELTSDFEMKIKYANFCVRDDSAQASFIKSPKTMLLWKQIAFLLLFRIETQQFESCLYAHKLPFLWIF